MGVVALVVVLEVAIGDNFTNDPTIRDNFTEYSLSVGNIGRAEGTQLKAEEQIQVWTWITAEEQIWIWNTNTQEQTASAIYPEYFAEAIEYSQDIQEIQTRFFAGYDVAGGPAEYRDHFIDVINCESHWQIDPGNPNYYGLGQFTEGTWHSYARLGADPYDAWEQGWAVADLAGDLIDRGLSPGSSGGWPHCFNVW